MLRNLVCILTVVFLSWRAQATCFGSRTYWVQPGAAAKNTGTLKSPYSTIAKALTTAKSTLGCDVTVNLKVGTYAETLTVTLPTTLHGLDETGVVLSGRIVNSSVNRLSIDSLTFSRPTPSLGAWLLGFANQATIDVSNPLADTVLYWVTIRGAWGQAIRQSGGTLEAWGLDIEETLDSAGPDEGAALLLRGGIAASVTSAYLHHNVQGLVADGAGTRVGASSVTVDGVPCGLRCASVSWAAGTPSGVGGIEVRNGARVIGTVVNLSDIAFAGLYLHDLGSANVISLSVADAHLVNGTDGFQHGGGGLLVLADAALEASYLDIGPNEFIGVTMGVGARVSLSDGEVHDTQFGVYVMDGALSDLDCLRRRVAYRNDAINLASDSMPVPGVGDVEALIPGGTASSPDAAPPQDTCAHVPRT